MAVFLAPSSVNAVTNTIGICRPSSASRCWSARPFMPGMWMSSMRNVEERSVSRKEASEAPAHFEMEEGK